MIIRCITVFTAVEAKFLSSLLERSHPPPRVQRRQRGRHRTPKVTWPHVPTSLKGCCQGALTPICQPETKKSISEAEEGGGGWGSGVSGQTPPRAMQGTEGTSPLLLCAQSAYFVLRVGLDPGFIFLTHAEDAFAAPGTQMGKRAMAHPGFEQ